MERAELKHEEIPHGYVEMTFVKETATGRGRNEMFSMEDMGNGSMKVMEGRIGITVGRYKPKVEYRPMEDWDMVYNSRINRGWITTKKQKMDKVTVNKGTSPNNGNYAPIEDEHTREFVEELTLYAKHIFDTSYTVKVDDISDEMIALGEKTLKELSEYEEMSVAEFNGKLKLLFAIIPRRMDKLSKHLAKKKADFPVILSDEQDLFDIMIAQVKNNSQAGKRNSETILKANGLEIRPVTDEEEAFIKKLLKGRSRGYLEAFRVTNHETEKNFEEFAKAHDLSEKNGIKHLFHGTKHENVWSIATTGIKTRPPKDVVITGKAYGQGSYFAPDAVKSLGYTSMKHAKWTNGTSDFGFLLICKVAVGKDGTYYDGHLGIDSSLCASKLEAISPGSLCTWAEARHSGFMLDEVIVYQDAQSTIEYIVRITKN